MTAPLARWSLPRPRCSIRRRLRSGRTSAHKRRRSSGRHSSVCAPPLGTLKSRIGVKPAIDKMATHAESRKDLIADCTGGGGEIVDRDCGANEGCEVAAVNGAVGQIGDVDTEQVH